MYYLYYELCVLKSHNCDSKITLFQDRVLIFIKYLDIKICAFGPMTYECILHWLSQFHLVSDLCLLFNEYLSGDVAVCLFVMGTSDY